jgi:uncharacterized protein
MAIAGSIGAADLPLAIGYMALFGLGTLPLLLVVSLLGNVVSQTIRQRINKVVPFVVVLIGIIFILRGSNLGIPYLSPPKAKMTPSMHMKADTAGVTKAVKASCCHTDSAEVK